MTRYVALLRGVNVGGRNMVSMKELKASFEELGFKQVSTYINSGNILFQSGSSDPRKLETKIDQMLMRDYELKGGTVVRSLDELAKLVKTIEATWPRPDANWRYNVIFLRHTIDSKKVLEQLQPKPEIEQVTYCPGTLLWSARQIDAQRTTMAKLSGKPIFRDMTVRNLNTTRKLFELLNGME